MDDGRRVFPLWRHVRFKTSVKLRSTPLPRVDGARPLTGAAAYQRRGTYPPPRIRFSFQTSPHRTHRQYDVGLGVLLVVVSSRERQTGHAFGGS